MLGQRAGELAALVALAVKNKLTASAIADTVHIYPSYALGVRRAADQAYTRKLTPTIVKFISFFLRFRGPRT